MDGWKEPYRVFLDPVVYEKAKSMSRIREMTIEEWVDETLRKAVGDSPEAVEAKVQAILEVSSKYQFPIDEIEEMIREIHGEQPTQ